MLYKRVGTMKHWVARSDPWVGLGLVVLFALILRLLHLWQMQGTLFESVLLGDSRGYDAWAQQIAAGDWVGKDVFYQAPLYPYFLAVTYRLMGHDLLMVRLVQAVLGALSCGLLGYAGTRFFDRRVGIVAGVMLAAYPPAIFFDGLIQKSVLDVFLLCLGLAFCAGLATGRPALLDWAVLGAVMGALSLTRENALLLAAVVGIWAVRRSGARAALALAAGLVVVLAPVAIRNYAVGGEWYLTTSQFGSNLYIGNNPRSDGSYMSLREGRGSPEFERIDATELAEASMGRSLRPSEVSRFWLTQTREYIESQPIDWLRLMLRKSRLLLGRTEIVDTESQESHAEYSLVIGVASHVWHFGVLLPLAIFGMFLAAAERDKLWPLYAMSLTYALSVVLFFVVARYRLPLVPLLIPFAAGAVERLWRLCFASGAKQVSIRMVPALAATTFVAVLAAWPAYSAAEQKAITEANLGVALQESGQLTEAIEHYQRALALRPGYTPALSNLGTALRAAGRVDEAVALYGLALERDGDKATTHLNLGNAFMSQGRVSEAIASFRRAVSIDPTAHAREALAFALYDDGVTALERGELDRASERFREAIHLKAGYADAHNNLGIALASQGRLKEAIAEWEEALRLNPSLSSARQNLEKARSIR
jgi:tetratricopeptide (TPR) repeat protein